MRKGGLPWRGPILTPGKIAILGQRSQKKPLAKALGRVQGILRAHAFELTLHRFRIPENSDLRTKLLAESKKLLQSGELRNTLEGTPVEAVSLSKKTVQLHMQGQKAIEAYREYLSPLLGSERRAQDFIDAYFLLFQEAKESFIKGHSDIR